MLAYASQSFQQQIQATTAKSKEPAVKLSKVMLERVARKVLKTKRASKARKESEARKALKENKALKKKTKLKEKIRLKRKKAFKWKSRQAFDTHVKLDN